MTNGTLRIIRTAKTPTIGELLDDQLSEFDELLRDVRGGIRSPAQFDELEERASRIGQKIRDAFRSRRAAERVRR